MGRRRRSTEVRDPRAYLVRITTRLAAQPDPHAVRRRESYVGPWLPEPLLTSPDVAEDVELADSVSTAMLLVLETLTPTERAVFVLREVFDLPYDEIAAAVDKTPAAVRQIAHRARSHVEARRPREVVGSAQRDAVIERFLAAVATGDLQSLMDVLAPDVVLITDGGGVKQAALRPIQGADKVLPLPGRRCCPRATARRPPSRRRQRRPGLRLLLDGELDTIATHAVDDGLVTGLYFVRNPDKLERVDEEAASARDPRRAATRRRVVASADALNDRVSTPRQGSAVGAESAETAADPPNLLRLAPAKGVTVRRRHCAVAALVATALAHHVLLAGRRGRRRRRRRSKRVVAGHPRVVRAVRRSCSSSSRRRPATTSWSRRPATPAR